MNWRSWIYFRDPLSVVRLDTFLWFALHSNLLTNSLLWRRGKHPSMQADYFRKTKTLRSQQDDGRSASHIITTAAVPITASRVETELGCLASFDGLSLSSIVRRRREFLHLISNTLYLTQVNHLSLIFLTSNVLNAHSHRAFFFQLGGEPLIFFGNCLREAATPWFSSRLSCEKKIPLGRP